MAATEIYLTEEEFAGRYHLGRRTVQRWRQTGDGPAWVRLGARRVLYRLSDCEVWAAERTYRHRADELARSAAAVTARWDAARTKRVAPPRPHSGSTPLGGVAQRAPRSQSYQSALCAYRQEGEGR
jgi:hypothetical protein